MFVGTGGEEGLDPNRWHLGEKVVSKDQQRYSSDNMNKYGAQSFQLSPFQLSPKVTALLTQGGCELEKDWDTYLNRTHPGFSSYTATVGEHDASEQEKHTRVVGPSPSNWKAFKSRYKNWIHEVLAEINLLMFAKIAEHTTCELHDMHILRQMSSSPGGAVFDDHQDRHGVRYNVKLRWTVTLLVRSRGPATGFFMWNSGKNDSASSLRGVIPYESPGSGVLFPSMAWHRSVIPAKAHGPFEALKLSFFFAEPSERQRRYAFRIVNLPSSRGCFGATSTTSTTSTAPCPSLEGAEHQLVERSHTHGDARSNNKTSVAAVSSSSASSLPEAPNIVIQAELSSEKDGDMIAALLCVKNPGTSVGRLKVFQDCQLREIIEEVEDNTQPGPLVEAAFPSFESFDGWSVGSLKEFLERDGGSWFASARQPSKDQKDAVMDEVLTSRRRRRRRT